MPRLQRRKMPLKKVESPKITIGKSSIDRILQFFFRGQLRGSKRNLLYKRSRISRFSQGTEKSLKEASIELFPIVIFEDLTFFRGTFRDDFRGILSRRT